jgi:DNA-binding beta-propeller fold protein YncE
MSRVIRSRKVRIGGALAALALALGVSASWMEERAVVEAQANVQAPRFEVDPMWPKPMPNNWVMGMTIGVGIDERDNVWVIHRGNDPGNLDRTELANPPNSPKVSECCNPAPPVLAFDQAGNLVASWGGPGQGYDWPESNHGITIDHKGIVWIGGNGGPDAHVLKFTKDGKFLAQFGKAGALKDPASPTDKPSFKANSHDMNNFGRVAKIFIDPKANEAYLADGYFNKRVAVVDMDSGKIKRYWGAYGEKPDDSPMPRYNPTAPPDKQFRNPVHCADVSVDGLVYVCDRPNDRLQVFTKEGKFVTEHLIERQTLSDGSVWDIAFSKDPAQTYLYMADGANEHVRVYERKTMKLLTHFGYGGRQPGMFFGVHSIATDSKGNIFTTETYTGKRVQKFVYKGVGSVPAVQGVPWPKTGGN